ncbi:MAG: hypothetical protein IJG68_03450 [Bacilli bacterium]|nr:hypothetical protein [Bacilli bacterium]
MKKYLLLVLLLLLPLGVYAEECNSTKVKIKSINLDSKLESTEILEEAQFVDGSFKEEKVLNILMAMVLRKNHIS